MLLFTNMHQMRDARYALALLRRGRGHQRAGRHKENIFQLSAVHAVQNMPA